MPSKKGFKANTTSSKAKSEVAEDAFIVFGDDNKKKSKNKNNGPQQQDASPAESSKPSARQVIGGASWTGKLPVNLLSEHCQKQKWNKPEYSMRQRPGRDGHDKLYRSEVTLSKRDPKTGQVTTLSPFRVPTQLESVAEEPSALEARHFAAAWALFRISSMKSLHMALPPKYRDLWKLDFQQVKKADVAAGKAWLYDADPFAAEQKTQEIKVDIAKRQADSQKKAQMLVQNPSLALTQGHGGKVWERAPKIEMGAQIRSEIEVLARAHAVWNPHSLTIDQKDRQEISKELVSKGFRQTHVAEALDICKDKEEALEWLLLHVPEDDLPAFALPTGYSAGVALASGDISRDSRMRRLNSSGYPRELCSEMLRKADEDEKTAALLLQATLLPPQTSNPVPNTKSPHDVWSEEMMTLEAIFGDAFQITGQNECIIKLVAEDSTAVSLQFIRATDSYPVALPVLLMAECKLPAYIRLSAIKQALMFASDNLLGEPMIYNICQWIEVNLPDIVAHPTSLSELYVGESGMTKSTANLRNEGKIMTKHRVQRKPLDRRSSEVILSEWQARQQSSQQQDMNKARMKLPAWKKQEEIVKAIASHQVTIISGETGSGKSTQVVQFVLDSAIKMSKGASTNIVCTQPRRVAALSLADRVSSERCTAVGDEVGYSIRGETKASATTKITFMTTGVLLRRIQTASSTSDAVDGLTHIFVDEVHERSLDTDFLLALLKDALTSNKQLRIVMMSATLDAEVFTNYFGGSKVVAHAHIEGRTFPVEDLYLDDALRLTQTSAATEDDSESALDIGAAIRNSGAGINYNLIRDLVVNIDKELGSQRGAILIFLPGTLEIDRCLKAVSSLPNIVGFPLHASLMPAEQRAVFPPSPPGKRKVIAATNVAETSITIEDVVAVIDTGRVKETNYDVNNNVVRLEEVWASQAACKQRRGRAGRVRAGVCYKLFTRNVEAQMSPKPLPEIMRVPLEQLCLSVKGTGEERDVSNFLASTLTPPDQGAIKNALATLHTIGALEDNRLTALGTYLASIPADLRCAKLLVFGVLFDCIEPCLTIAAIMTLKDPFISPREKREEAKTARKAFTTAHGDLINALMAYEQYCVQIDQGLRYRSLQNWCGDHFLSFPTLRDITSTRGQLLDALKGNGLVALNYRSLKPSASSMPSHLLLRALISAALQPQIASISFPDKKYMQSLTGAKELDPEAKAIKYFTPTSDGVTPPMTDTDEEAKGSSSKQNERVFVHPSSLLFDYQSFTNSAAYISYFQKMATSKVFVRQLTPLNAYSLLLFGGKIYVDTATGAGLTVGGEANANPEESSGRSNVGFKIRGWARIGVLVSRLRQMLDDELRKAIDEPSQVHQFAKSEVVKIVRKLVELNGQDQ